MAMNGGAKHAMIHVRTKWSSAHQELYNHTQISAHMPLACFFVGLERMSMLPGLFVTDASC
jgi:hypothetical protein